MHFGDLALVLCLTKLTPLQVTILLEMKVSKPKASEQYDEQ